MDKLNLFTATELAKITNHRSGEIKFGVEGGFNSFNNFILKGIPAQGLSYIYDSLMDGVDDEIASRYGLIAKDVRFLISFITLAGIGM